MKHKASQQGRHTFLAVAAMCALLVPPSLTINPAVGTAHAAETQPCRTTGPLSYVCGVSNVEDMVQVPGTRWLIGSSMRLGKKAMAGGDPLYLIAHSGFVGG
jgi:hypothetical protein